MREFVVVYVTVGSAAEGERIASALVQERLAACVNRIPAVHSTYRWQGQVEQAEEQQLIIKTSRDLFSAIERRVKELHSYALPEVIALPVVNGSPEYLQWLDEQMARESK